METPVSKETRIAIIENEMMVYNNSVYQLGIRAKAARIVENKQLEEQCTKEIENCQKILDFLSKELATVKAETNLTLMEVKNENAG